MKQIKLWVDSKVVAVPEMEGQTVGAITFWRLSGSIKRSELEMLWLAAGLDKDDLPNSVTPVEALRRAAVSQARKDLLVRPLGRGAGFALVKETPTQGVPEYHVLNKIVLTDRGGNFLPEVQTPSVLDWEAVSLSNPLQIAVEAVYNEAVSTLSALDISNWLVKRVEALGSVRLRETGGIYFVPRSRTKEWRALTQVVRACSQHHLAEIPSLKSDEAVEAILDAVSQDVARTISEVQQELGKGLGSRALESRVELLSSTIGKVNSYGNLLGVSLGDLTSKLDDLKAQVVEAHIMAQQAKEAEQSTC